VKVVGPNLVNVTDIPKDQTHEVGDVQLRLIVRARQAKSRMIVTRDMAELNAARRLVERGLFVFNISGIGVHSFTLTQPGLVSWLVVR
jgi:hypothetical protein